MSAQTKIENYLNYITGSAGGWPSNTNIGVVGGVDYIIESGSDDIYLSRNEYGLWSLWFIQRHKLSVIQQNV